MTEIKNPGKAGQWLDPSTANQYPADSSTDSSTADAAANNAQVQGALPNHVPVGTASTQGTQAAGSVDGLSRTGSIKGVNYVARPEVTSSAPELPDVQGPSASPKQVLRALGAYVRQPANTDQQSPSIKAASTQGAGESSSQTIGYTGNANHVSLVEVYNILGDAAQKGLDLAGKIRIASGKNSIQSKINEVQALKEKIAGEQKSAATTFAASVGAAVLTATLAGRGTMMMGSSEMKFWDFARPGGFLRKNVKPHPSSQEKPDGSRASTSPANASNPESAASDTSSQVSAASAKAKKDADQIHVNQLEKNRTQELQNKPPAKPASFLDENSSVADRPARTLANTSKDGAESPPRRSIDNDSVSSSDTRVEQNGSVGKEPQKSGIETNKDAREKDRIGDDKDGDSKNSSSGPNNALGSALSNSAQQLGGIVTEATNLIDKMAGGKHEADQAEIQSKTEAVMSQIAQNQQESAKSSYDQALENIKNVFQTVSQTYQRWAQVTDNISNR